MATYNVTAAVQTITAAGMTTAQIIAIAPSLHDLGGDDWIVFNAREDAAVEGLAADVERRAAAPAGASGPAELRATEKQVAYIARLLAQGCGDEGGFITAPRSTADIAAMSRKAASQLIDSLTGRY